MSRPKVGLTPIPFAALIRSTRYSLTDRPQVRRPIQPINDPRQGNGDFNRHT